MMQNALVVTVQLPKEDSEIARQNFEELVGLLKTLGISISEQIHQNRIKLNPQYLIGRGKVDEIKSLIAAKEIDLVVFDKDLSPSQARNLEEALTKVVWDKTQVILNIFERHARSKIAKTQVEMAKLEYNLPRMTGAWTHLERQSGGGSGANRGMGEKQIEVDRRRARERITKLSKELEHIQKEKITQRKKRKSQFKVSLVGYTNSGKTTLMNALTNNHFISADRLFATLDTSARVIPKTKPDIILSDTVGFIKDLPHGLVESFKSTLDEVKEADLLIHVVDLSSEYYRQHIDTTDSVLKEIGAQAIPLIYVFNKSDQLPDRFLVKLIKTGYPNSICISAQNPADVLAVRNKIADFFNKQMTTLNIVIPFDQKDLISRIYEESIVINEDYSDDRGILFEIMGPKKLSHYLAHDARVQIL